MNRLIARELMDGPVDSLAELEGSLIDIEFVNRFCGGRAPVLREVRRRSVGSLLDVCCGSADIARCAADDARRRSVQLEVTVLDYSPEILAIARKRAAPAALRFVAGDARALPFADASFDLVTCNLALHHFEPDAAVVMLRELRRVARLTPLVNDLRRSPLALVVAQAWSRTSRNRLTRHDAPMSVRRAYTPAEACDLARAAGWVAPRARAEAFVRFTVIDEAVRA